MVNETNKNLEIRVLILVLVEHTLGEVVEFWPNSLCRLNPCFSGTYSRSLTRNVGNATRVVLILVLVEHTLGVPIPFRILTQAVS